MTRHWPKTWQKRSWLATCMLMLAGPTGCGLNKCPVAVEDPPASDASSESAEPITTVGFISATDGADPPAQRPSPLPAPSWAPDVPAASLELQPLPPIDPVRTVLDEELPFERAEEVFGEAVAEDRLPKFEPARLAPASGGRQLYVTELPESESGDPPRAAASAKSSVESPVEPEDLSSIPVFSALNTDPFELAESDEESAAAPPQVTPPSPANLPSVPTPNLGKALRGEKSIEAAPSSDAPTEKQHVDVRGPALVELPAASELPSADATAQAGETPRYGVASTTATTDEVAAPEASPAEAASQADPLPPAEIVADSGELEGDPLAAVSDSADRGTAYRDEAPAAEDWFEATTPTPLVQDDALPSAEVYEATLHPVATGVPTGARINQQAVAKIRHGYSLAQRGAYYSAQAEFVSVLQMLAQGKDHLTGRPRRTTALSAGLRALDEARDFAPRGGVLDANVDLTVLTSAHRTPIARSEGALLPQQLMDLYFRYAQVQLGAAVAGEPAGSMALHALGKLHSQLGRVEPEQHPLATRLAYSYQQAALLAHNQNHLAAHELGVLMAESGHYSEAEDLLQQVAAREPHPQVLKNLARVQEQLGRVRIAADTKTVATQMRSRYGSTNGITWVDPSDFAQSGRPEWRQAAPQRVAQQPQ